MEPLIAAPPSSGNLRIAYTILGTDLHRRLHCILATSQERNRPIPNSDPTLARQAHSFNSVVHALNCPHSGFPSIRHNELPDITAELLSEVCHNVGTEPPLQPITDEYMSYRTANREDGARLDIAAGSFWASDRQRAFFDIRVFNHFAPSYRNVPLA